MARVYLHAGIYVKLEHSSLNGGDGTDHITYHAPTELYWALSPDSLTTIHTGAPPAIETHS